MPISYIPYNLSEGYIHDWLFAGPQVITIEDAVPPVDASSKADIARHHCDDASGAASGIEQMPVEPGPLEESTFTVGDYEGTWGYFPCEADHFVDLTAFYPSPAYLRAWAYTQLVTERAQTVMLVLNAYGPVDVWLNGGHVHRSETLGFRQSTCDVSLREGANEVLVRFAQVGSRECAHKFALRVADAVADVSVRIPTAIEAVGHRNALAAKFAGAYLDRDVFTAEDPFTVYWPDDVTPSDDVTIRLQTPSGRIYAESKALVKPGESWSLMHGRDAPPGLLYLRLLPRTELFYEENLRVTREIPIWGTGVQTYSEVPYGTYPARRAASLQYAVNGRGLFAEVAKMALGQWHRLELPVIMSYIEAVERGEVNSGLYLVGLLGTISRWGEHPDFPSAVKARLQACVTNFKGWDADLDAASESDRILLHTAEILAGQLYPLDFFTPSEQSGRRHRERGERLALDWLRRRGAGGFADWDSGEAFAAELVALSHLVDLSESETICEMVTVIMDKLLVSIALNAHQGVFGGTQGAADVTTIKGGLLSPTAGITRLFWGEGVFNHHLAGMVSLACMEDYEILPLAPDIAITRHEELWNRESHRVTDDLVVNKVTYRTPDYMLSSAQDYRPGEPGKREHVWQATLGPEAVVYTSHPASMGRSAAHVPGFWLGNATLPRVAQWKDALIAVYRLPEDDWMGFTHAYFPAYAFDAYEMRKNDRGQRWAFAKKGEGYLALTASTDWAWMTPGSPGAPGESSAGPGAWRELRAYGHETIWCCQMGRGALDGDFAAFQERVLALPLTFEALAVHFETLRGETLTFGWDGPFARDGVAQPLSGFKHYENPYTVTELDAPEMEIRSEHYLMRLRFT